jgi:4,5-dihydroxyphthalate decarboxylase
VIKLPVTLAVSVYDHVRDLTEGKIPIEGIDLIPLELPVEEIFHRFIAYREWDVSELSLAKYVAMRAAGTADFTAIPVFPSRMFRMSSVYVLQESKLREPRDLAGKRIGVPEWAQTAAVYTRGWLSETVGLDLADINWVQAGVNEPGRKEKVTILMPDGVECISRPDSSLTELLRNGEIDAMFTAHPPRPIEEGTAEFRRMIGNTREVEERYFRETGIFPNHACYRDSRRIDGAASLDCAKFVQRFPGRALGLAGAAA